MLAETAARFATAVALGDESGARACVASWEPERDGPASLFRQLAYRAVRIEVTGAPRPGAGGRAAIDVAVLASDGRRLQTLALLAEGDSGTLTGVATGD